MKLCIINLDGVDKSWAMTEARSLINVLPGCTGEIHQWSFSTTIEIFEQTANEIEMHLGNVENGLSFTPPQSIHFVSDDGELSPNLLNVLGFDDIFSCAINRTERTIMFEVRNNFDGPILGDEIDG